MKYSLGNTVSVLGREEGYTVKYGLGPIDFPRLQLEGNPDLCMHCHMFPREHTVPYSS